MLRASLSHAAHSWQALFAHRRAPPALSHIISLCCRGVPASTKKRDDVVFYGLAVITIGAGGDWADPLEQFGPV